MKDEILNLLRKSYCSDLEFEERGIDKYMVHTGYTYPDGDELHILIKKQNNEWLFTDDGHTTMWLSYSDFEIKGTRKILLEKTLASNKVTMEDGILLLKINSIDYSDLGAYLRSMIQAEIQIADLLYMEKESIKSTFSEDLKSEFSESEMAKRCKYDYTIIDDNDSKYTADIYIEGEKPLLIFGIHTTLQCTRAIIAMMTLKNRNQKCMFMTVFDDEARLEKNDFNKAINESTKTIMGTKNAVNGAIMLLNL